MTDMTPEELRALARKLNAMADKAEIAQGGYSAAMRAYVREAKSAVSQVGLKAAWPHMPETRKLMNELNACKDALAQVKP